MTATQTVKIPKTFMGYPANADGLTSIQELLEQQDLAYGVDKIPATYEWDGESRTAANQFHLVREDNGNCLSQATVTKTYRVLTPSDIGAEFQWFVDGGFASPFSAFRTGTGVETIALLMNPDLFDIDGYAGFILGQNRQGQMGAKGSLFVWRQICSNGMMGWAKSGTFSISHRGDVRQKYVDHTRDWKRMEEAFQQMNERMTQLSGIPMTVEQFMAATDALHGTTVEGDKVIDLKTRDEASTRKLNIREDIIAATNMPDMGTFGNSAADFYNAVTYRLSHLRSGSTRTETALADSLLSGSGFAEERRALAILDRFVKDGTIVAPAR